MQVYYFYSKNKEVSQYVVESLNTHDIQLVQESSDLFDIDEKNSLVILHTNSCEDKPNELVQYLIKEYKHLKILALSNNNNYLEGTSLLRDGVKGYGNVYMHPVHLQQAVEVIESGNVWIYPELALHLIRNISNTNSADENKMSTLTEHEKECAMLVADGSSNKEIARTLDRQEITIKKHLSSVYQKLNVKNRMELMLYLKQ